MNTENLEIIKLAKRFEEYVIGVGVKLEQPAATVLEGGRGR